MFCDGGHVSPPDSLNGGTTAPYSFIRSKRASAGQARLRHSTCRRWEESRKWMRSRRLEFEAPRLFGSRDLLELVHTKNVIELSVLHFERDGRSTQEYELTRNDFDETEKRDRVFALSLLYSGARLIFDVAPARGDWGIRRLASMWNDRRGSADTVHVSVGRRDAGITAKAGLIQINDQMRDRTLASNKPPHPTRAAALSPGSVASSLSRLPTRDPDGRGTAG